VNQGRLAEIITETESLLMDGEFTARFNRHLVQSITPSQPAAAPEKPAATNTTPSFPQNDAELRTLKTKLQAELEEAAKIKAGLAARERTLKENEQKLREQEQAFAARCKREQEAIDETKAKLGELEAEIVRKDREAEEARAEQLAQLEETKAELAARSLFIDESEQRLLVKGQEQLETLAEMEQKEEELMNIKRELNAMRKEMGIPMIPLRAKPVDEFEE
jgi:DNA repair exonuclease SbcCD ATPase subunit